MSDQIPRAPKVPGNGSADVRTLAAARSGAAVVRRKPRRPVQDPSWTHVNAARVSDSQRSGGLARLWRLATLAILLPVLVMVGLRAYRQLPSAAYATELLAGALDRELPMPSNVLHATITLHSEPAAEVWVDGKHVGQTPIERLAIEIGPHEIRFHHPTYGNRVHEIIATRSQPLQLSVDLTRP